MLNNNSKQIVLLAIFVASFSAILFTVSFAFAQVSNIDSKPAVSSVSGNVTSDPVQIIPYHPRDPVAYYAEKKQLDSQVAAASLLKSLPKSFNKLTASSPVNIIPGFDGLNVTSATFHNNKQDPPDVQVAVGSGNIFEMVQVKGKTYTKSGVANQTIALDTLFKLTTSNHILGDPKILYDSISERWFASIADFTNDTVSIAVSKTSDPSVNNWYVHHEAYNTTGVGAQTECPDQPKIGLSDDKFVVSTNDVGSNVKADCFSSTASNDGAEYRVFDKNQMLSGTFTNIFTRAPLSSEFAVTPVQSMSSTGDLYMVSDGAVSSTHQVKLFTLTGTSPVTLSSTSINLATARPNILTPPSATQPITSTHISTGDTRILNAVWQKGNLWFSLNDKCTPAGDSIRSCARLMLINTNTTKIIQDFDINSTGSFLFYPALTVDSFGGIGVVFGTSNDTDPTGYPSLIVTGQAANDPVNSIKQLSYLTTGSHYEDGKEDSNFNTLYGDYYGAALDSSNNTRIWVAGEYNTLANGHLVPTWSTFIGSINFDCVPPISGDWIITASCTLASSATAQANVIVQNNSLLTIPNGISLNIDFKNNHLLVKSGSGVYIAPGGKIT